jgi:S-adenosylmethionine:tRNA ribosyltransferase-isomerase
MTAEDLRLECYQYHLPPERIAQSPVVPRDHSRLLVVDEILGHYHFWEIGQLLQAGDLLVFNNTQVIPARLRGHKVSGAQVEVLLLEPDDQDCWTALVKPGRKIRPGNKLVFGAPSQPDLVAQVLDRHAPTGGRKLKFELPAGTQLLDVLGHYGEIPLPPYVTTTEARADQYPGSVAAPTAGLHFTPELLEQLARQGIDQAEVTLHVGVGTFRPVTAATITDHQMHREWLRVPAGTVAKIKATQGAGGRVIAVGTTTVRSLEAAAPGGELQEFCGHTDIFIYPGYRWRIVDGLITNFHLPGSSLMMLVGAAIGRQRLLEVYQGAIAADYRFYSFGDAMFIPRILGQIV